MSPFYTKIIIFVCLCMIICNWFYIHLLLAVPEIFDAPENTDLGRIRQHGDYWVWHNYLRSELSFNGNESVTLTTHGTYQDLPMLSMLVYRWRGPVSLTLYTNDEDFDKTIESLGFINACLDFGELLRRYVTVHLCFHHQHVPPALDHNSFWHTPSPFVCAFEPLFKDGTQATTFWYRHKLPYPVNLLRNVARFNALTHFVMPLDMDLLPTHDFPMKFMEFITHAKTLINLPMKSIFCLTTFVHDYVSPLPNSKRQLMEVLNRTNISKAKGFDDPMRQQLWLQSGWYEDRISLFDIAKLNDMCVAYVTVNKLEPLYDERFVMESIYQTPNNIHSYVLNYLNFTFINLDGTFLFRRANNSWHNVDTAHITKTTNAKQRSFGADFMHFHGNSVVKTEKHFLNSWLR